MAAIVRSFAVRSIRSVPRLSRPLASSAPAPKPRGSAGDVVLLYSGGLDTSTILVWLIEQGCVRAASRPRHGRAAAFKRALSRAPRAALTASAPLLASCRAGTTCTRTARTWARTARTTRRSAPRRSRAARRPSTSRTCARTSCTTTSSPPCRPTPCTRTCTSWARRWVSRREGRGAGAARARAGRRNRPSAAAARPRRLWRCRAARIAAAGLRSARPGCAA